MAVDDEIECFAQRLLNPFRGTQHILRLGAAEAITLDGVNWDLYVTDEQLFEGLGHGPHVQVGDIRYGRWSEVNGLKRGPIQQSDDFRRLEALGDRLFDVLKSGAFRPPFPLLDRYELWLLDQAGRPLALLQSSLDGPSHNLENDLNWRACPTARERFHPSGPSAEAAPSTGLAESVNARAGRPPAAAWYERLADGGGRLCRVLPEAVAQPLSAKQLNATDFPPLLLDRSGVEGDDLARIDAFLAWQAVWLLTLDGLATDLRRELEGQARQQAERVEGQYRLYPEILDPATLNAARVEARLASVGEAEPNAAAFFDELVAVDSRNNYNPCPSD
jgi:hypothetical protein